LKKSILNVYKGEIVEASAIEDIAEITLYGILNEFSSEDFEKITECFHHEKKERSDNSLKDYILLQQNQAYQFKIIHFWKSYLRQVKYFFTTQICILFHQLKIDLIS
jgi:hypothetical protein